LQILIADDSTEVRNSLKKFLARFEHLQIVAEATDAVEALNKTLQLKPDLLLLDIKMPKGSGLEVAEKIKKQLPECIIIMLTNFASNEFRNRAIEKGVDFFFDKSSEFEKVADVIKNILAKSSQ